MARLRRHRVPLRHRVRLRRLGRDRAASGCLARLFRLVRRDPEHRGDPAHAPDVTRAAEWVADYVRRLGGEAEVREEGRLIVSEILGPPGAPTVLVYGHYDVQPPDPLDLWE